MNPKSYKCRFIEPGIMSYEDTGNGGIVFVGKPALDALSPTFKGCPVICVPEDHNEAAPDVSFNADAPEELKPVGIVSGHPYWEDDGWQWVDFLVWDEETAKRIDRDGFSVSCAYLPTETKATGGTWHQIDYDEEIVDGHYLHLAIVPRPRYEGSRIIANSKGGKMKFKLFPKKNAIPEPKKEDAPEMENAEELDPATIVQLEDGSEVTLAALMEAWKAQKGEDVSTEDDATPAPALNADDEVAVDGERVKVGDMVNAYTAACSKKNAEPPQDEEAPEAGLPKENSKKKVNAALKNAVQKTSFFDSERPETRGDRLEKGKARYSKTVSQGGKA